MTLLIYADESINLINSNLIPYVDHHLLVLNISENWHTPQLNSFMKLFSDFGREYFWSFTMIGLFLFGKKEGRITAVLIMISILVIIPVNILLKDVIDRERPSSINNEFDGSYPSGHASIVSAGALVSVLFFNNTLKKKAIVSVLFIEASLVCISRIYVESHYPLDVMGGILLGSGVALLVSSYAKSADAILSYLFVNATKSYIYLKLRKRIGI